MDMRVRPPRWLNPRWLRRPSPNVLVYAYFFFFNILSSPPHRSFLLQDYAEDSMEGVYYCAVCNEGEAAAYGKKHGYGEDLKEVALREEGPVEAEDGGIHAGIVVDQWDRCSISLPQPRPWRS